MITGKNFAYVRVSTVEQNDARQLEALKDYNIDKFFTEKVSAKDTNRLELNKMLDFVREGDTIYILDFSRLARSTKDLLGIVEKLKEKKVKLVSLKEQFDTNTSAGKMMLTMLGAIYEFERANILERQREGIALAKLAGKFKGRKKIEYPEGWGEIYSKWKQRGITAVEAMHILGLKKNTFYKLRNEWEISKVA